ncbi:MAG: PSD1 and planctomycete cytochrome C domain-containing protein, partial [Planctomycetota bacterium]
TKIRPALAEHCYQCHSAAAAKDKKLKAGLFLDTASGVRKGGDSGPAVAVGDPEKSLLMHALRGENNASAMPPKGKLPKAIVDDFATWIRIGAPDPRGKEPSATAAGIDLAKGRQHWAFQSPKLPAVPNEPGVDQPIDAFVRAKLAEKGLTPAAPADRRTLGRRITFDLIGLPPEPDELDAFVADTSPGAVAKLVEKLLASPHYGERWGRHWLDVARYGEDQSINGVSMPNGFRYRDWVIAAFNNDMPFDQFIRLQIAGDMLPESEGDIVTRLAGTGLFILGLSLDNGANKNPLKEADELDDRIDTLTRGLLGLTVSCARCHDHKFDPIPVLDYYSLAGIFRGVNGKEVPLATPEEVNAYETADKLWRHEHGVMTKWLTVKFRIISEQQAPDTARYLAAVRGLLEAGVQSGKNTDQPKIDMAAADAGVDRQYLRQWVAFFEPNNAKNVPAALKAWRTASPQDAPRLAAEFQNAVEAALAATKTQPTPGKGAKLSPEAELVRVILHDGNSPFATKSETPEKRLSKEDAENFAVMKKKVANLQKAVPPRYAVLRALSGNGAGMKVYLRGNPATLGAPAPPRFLQALSAPDAPTPTTFTRLDLANAIASKENPLTARVIVNRVWAWHFGRGLVNTPSNFGVLGERPTHPELLDWLAVQFMEHGWSLKWLHREIMKSATYQQASAGHPANAEKDGDNSYLWRANRRRLEIEPSRDSLLAVAGKIDRTVGGPSTDLADVTVGLQSKVTEPVERQFHDDLYAGFSFCRGWAPQLMREYAALRNKEVKK